MALFKQYGKVVRQTNALEDEFKELGLIITKQWQFKGRVPYLKYGKKESGRRCDDSIFEFRVMGEAAIEVVEV